VLVLAAVRLTIGVHAYGRKAIAINGIHIVGRIGI
jgi:hypothetical protein